MNKPTWTTVAKSNCEEAHALIDTNGLSHAERDRMLCAQIREMCPFVQREESLRLDQPFEVFAGTKTA